ncbi:MAG: hypothetical protein ACE15F_22775 [bacterium]
MPRRKPMPVCMDIQLLGYDRFTKLVEKKIRLRAIDFLDQVFQSVDSQRLD